MTTNPNRVIDDTRHVDGWIRNYRHRKAWELRNGPCSTVAFYNTGKNLFIDPLRRPANVFYRKNHPWQWIPYKEFCGPVQILASHRRIAGFLDDSVPFQHLGHGKNGLGVASIKIGAVYDRTSADYVPGVKLDIPPGCILYVAVLYGHFKDFMLVVQPLPMSMMSKKSVLKAVPKQVLVAVKR